MAYRESQDELAARAGVSRLLLASIEPADHPAGLLSYTRLAPLAELLDGAP